MRRRGFLKLLASLPLAAAVRPLASTGVGALRSSAPTYPLSPLALDPWQRELLARRMREHYEILRACCPPITWDTNTRSWRPVV